MSGIHITDHDAEGTDLVCDVCKRDIQRYESKVLIVDNGMRFYLHHGDCEREYIQKMIQERIDEDNHERMQGFVLDASH